MGIQGLLPFVAAATDKSAHVGVYAGKRVAIDGFVWLHTGAHACAFELGQGIALILLECLIIVSCCLLTCVVCLFVCLCRLVRRFANDQVHRRLHEPHQHAGACPLRALLRQPYVRSISTCRARARS